MQFPDHVQNHVWIFRPEKCALHTLDVSVINYGDV